MAACSNVTKQSTHNSNITKHTIKTTFTQLSITITIIWYLPWSTRGSTVYFRACINSSHAAWRRSCESQTCSFLLYTKNTAVLIITGYVYTTDCPPPTGQDGRRISLRPLARATNIALLPSSRSAPEPFPGSKAVGLPSSTPTSSAEVTCEAGYNPIPKCFLTFSEKILPYYQTHVP